MSPRQAILAEGRLRLTLGEGKTYHVLAGNRETKRALLEEMSRLADTAAVTADGGLLEDLCVAENLALPLQYRGDARQGELAAAAREWFAACGLDREFAARLMARHPGSLNPFERRAAGFVRAMLQEPEILVLDTLHDGLTDAEDRRAARFETAFHQRHPFRTVIHLELDRRPTPMESALHV